MKCKDLIDALKKIDPEKQIIVFDDNSVPYEIKCVVVDDSTMASLSHIVLKPVEGGMI